MLTTKAVKIVYGLTAVITDFSLSSPAVICKSVSRELYLRFNLVECILFL